MKWVRDPLLWLTGLFIALLYLMPHSAALFNALIPGLPRPVYQQESFVNLTTAHFWLVAVSSVIAIVLGTGAGIAVTRPAGRSSVRWWRPLPQRGRPSAGGRTGDCRAGDRFWAGASHHCADFVRRVAHSARDAGGDCGGACIGAERSGRDGDERPQRLVKVELPLAAPVIIAGVRTSVIINIGTATIASTVGANTLGTPIIIGLSGFNTAYIIQGRFWLRWRRLSWIACLNAAGYLSQHRREQ